MKGRGDQHSIVGSIRVMKVVLFLLDPFPALSDMNICDIRQMSSEFGLSK